MNTKDFRTHAENFPAKHPELPNKRIIALDIGYSGVKGYTPDGYFCFPSFVKEIPKGMLDISDKYDLIYEDLDTGRRWMAGKKAQDMMSQTDTNDTSAELFTRKRYRNPKFHIIAMIGIALGMLDADGQITQEHLDIQTGLPPAYLQEDMLPLVRALTAPANFRLKFGRKPYMEFHIQLTPEQIHVMSQPKGTLFSIVCNQEGHFIPGAGQILAGDVLIFDAGFNTLDLYGIKERMNILEVSKDSLGMKRVLEETSKKIFAKYQTSISVPAMQQNLEKGTFDYFNEEELASEQVPFADMLEQSVHEVCEEAIGQLLDVTNTLRDYRYLVITGGTGYVWEDQIREKFKNIKTITILSGAQAENISAIYSNVRGYYFFRYQMNRQGIKEGI